jgi:hypothetical protein
MNVNRYIIDMTTKLHMLVYRRHCELLRAAAAAAIASNNLTDPSIDLSNVPPLPTEEEKKNKNRTGSQQARLEAFQQKKDKLRSEATQTPIELCAPCLTLITETPLHDTRKTDAGSTASDSLASSSSSDSTSPPVQSAIIQPVFWLPQLLHARTIFPDSIALQTEKGHSMYFLH